MSDTTKPVGPAMQVLINQVLTRFNTDAEQLAAVALNDAKLDPADGWRFDIHRRCCVRETPTVPSPSAE